MSDSIEGREEGSFISPYRIRIDMGGLTNINFLEFNVDKETMEEDLEEGFKKAKMYILNED